MRPARRSPSPSAAASPNSPRRDPPSRTPTASPPSPTTSRGSTSTSPVSGGWWRAPAGSRVRRSST
ncbi:MAG: hypothetical protein E6G17_11115 [Actinobacteria bacterium]|nr:MAG: hypothetical protein E6G17_11115 [Actinomycetota bacterium]